MNEVEIVVKSNDKTDFNAITAKARENMVKSVRSGLDDVDRSTNTKFKQIGQRSGDELGSALDEHLKRWGEHATETVDVKVKTKFKETGHGAGSMFSSGLRDGMKGIESVGSDAATQVGQSAESSLASTFREAGAYGMAALAAVLIASAPAIGAVAALGIVMAFGAGLAGLGLVAAFKLKSVQKEFKGFQKFLGSFMKDIGKPFEETWATIFNVAGNVLKTFQPILKGAFKDFIAPAVTSFVLQLGKAFTMLAPAIRPVSQAFAAVLGSVGKSLPSMFQGIAEAITEMAATITKNPELFAGFITGMMQVVVGGLKFIAFLAKVFAAISHFEHTKNPFLTWLAPMSPLLAFFLHFRTQIESIWKTVSRFAGKAMKFQASFIDHATHPIKILIGVIGKIARSRAVHVAVTGAATAVSWVGKVIGVIRRFIGKVVHIGISGAQPAINLVRNLINIIRRLAGRVVRVGANVFGIGAVHSLIGAIRGVASKTVNIVARAFGFAHGGIVGGHAAEGGPRSNTVMVGEHGPELVNLAAGSRVKSNSDTRRILGEASGNGGGGRLQVEWVGGNASDEFITWIKKNIRFLGGTGPNSVQRAFGQG